MGTLVDNLLSEIDLLLLHKHDRALTDVFFSVGREMALRYCKLFLVLSQNFDTFFILFFLSFILLVLYLFSYKMEFSPAFLKGKHHLIAKNLKWYCN